MNARRKFIRDVGRGVTGGLLARVLPAGVATLLLPRLARAGVVLDPTNPGNFQRDGAQSFTSGTVLTLADQSVGDIILFFAPEPDAAAGTDFDVIATFQVRATVHSGADVGNRLVINDGVMRAAVAACIFDENGVKGIGLLAQ